MKRNFAILLFFAFAVVLTPRHALGATSVDEQVKKLAQRYSQVEAQLDRSIHYSRKTEANGVTTIEQAWLNGAGDLVKAAVERSDSSGRELTEYFARNFYENGDEPVFILTRKETPLPDGGTQVDESRKYFANWNSDELIRELTKSARFKAGESTDTASVPNVIVDLSKRARDQQREEKTRYGELDFPPFKIAETLKKAGPPASDPFTNIKGNQEKFRAIHGTVSPDGRYAIALGFAREQINWDDFVKESSEYEKTYEAREEEDVCNCVVDLARQRILGQTSCNYFSTDPGPMPGRIACQVEWSPDSTQFVEEWEQKTFETGAAGKIGPGPKLAGVVDIEKEIDKKTLAYVKNHPAALWMDVEQVNNDGTILVKVEVADWNHSFEVLFSLNERLRLRETPNGLRLENLNVHRLPAE